MNEVSHRMLSIPKAGFGQFPSTSAWYWGQTPRAVAVKAVAHALDQGMTAVDTSPCYGWGVGEEIVGRIVGNDEGIQVFTKCGLRWDKPHGEPLLVTNENGYSRTLWRDLRPVTVRSECESSLRRLRRDCIDLYQCHWPDPLTPFDDTFAELLRLRDEGKIAMIGLSNWAIADLQSLVESNAIACVQIRFNPLKTKSLDLLVSAGIVDRTHVIAYAPLEQGLLGRCSASGRLDAELADRANRRWFSESGSAAIRAAFQKLEGVTTKYELSPAQLILASVMRTPGIDTTLIGMRSDRHILEAIAASEVMLDETDRQLVFEVFAATALAFRSKGM